ncbi:hypothetical protein GGX14DRAFT_574050 [Mycena pura]|uniref:Uncharacterized protein n=1 Tax=Mycena pura TaxID=153505 RepID=A0AAD6V582_9AGAR|nr:hypothetical protein GGX14DRAFT_574050 [Mycena pura]
MGRCAKYFTADDRVAAQRQYSRKWAITPVYVDLLVYLIHHISLATDSAKAIQAEARAVRCSRKVSAHRIPRVKPLPDHLERLAKFSLPETNPAYDAAMRGILDLRPLLPWQDPPPFNAPAPEEEDPPHPRDSVAYAEITTLMGCSLHVLCFREECANDERRREAYTHRGKKMCMDEWRTELAEHVAYWRHLLDVCDYDPKEDAREHAMWQIWTVSNVSNISFFFWSVKRSLRGYSAAATLPWNPSPSTLLIRMAASGSLPEARDTTTGLN